jgi:hypothetical protein
MRALRMVFPFPPNHEDVMRDQDGRDDPRTESMDSAMEV